MSICVLWNSSTSKHCNYALKSNEGFCKSCVCVIYSLHKRLFFQFCYTLFWKICINAFINVQRDCVKFMNIMFCFKNRLGIDLDAYKETKENPIENYVT